ncbi:MAG: exodeoxyribonuclease III [Alphaproteobacteria bacterium]|nr:exodeoxyribonuclease III [Alphaproteobacteria bacterium]
MVQIVTWNVNSIKVRLPHVLRFLEEHKPDVVMLQEIKCVTDAFPKQEFEYAGYICAVHGQKTYNGVAILSRYPLEDIVTTLPGGDQDEQARYLEAVVTVGKEVIRLVNVYVPNGGEPKGEKWAYKLGFYDRLLQHMQRLLAYEEKLVLGGDFNVAPDPIDVYDPKSLKGTTCFHPDEWQHYRPILNVGLIDSYRALYPHTPQYSWWDYRSGAWNQNKGMRIDHLLLSPEATDSLKQAGVYQEERGREQASDHAPVWCEF